MCKRYAALSLIPFSLLLLGFAALAMPATWRGPLVGSLPAGPATGQVALLGSALLRQPLYLSDVVGLALLVVAMLTMWTIAIAWEVRRHRLPAVLPPAARPLHERR